MRVKEVRKGRLKSRKQREVKEVRINDEQS